MKELSIEERAKRYDEAIERARYWEKNPTVWSSDDICQKLFPELKEESGDERIRKELIEYIKDQQSSFISAPDCRDKYEEEENNKYNSWIAWLEKQVEQKHISWYDLEKSKEAGYTIVPNEEYDRLTKPAEWSEEDELMLTSIIQTLKLTNGAAQMKIDWIKSIKNRVQPQPKQEWSKEDEEISSAIVKRLEGSCALSVDLQSAICWVENVKDRVQPQPKQEWNEEDKNIIEDVETCLDTFCEYLEDSSSECIPVIKKLISKLKSLRPQSLWKPSDEQMEYLAKAILTLGNEGDCKTASILNELRTNLKKLKR